MGIASERRQKLITVKEQLKKEFVGIDSVIDEVIDQLTSWYCFPEGQIRPTVVNLVGMTGVGKTSLIERLFVLLGLENSFYKFDMGYYASSSESMKNELSKKVLAMQKRPVCFVLDEFQLCRSVNAEGDEIDRSNFRPIWDLMDSGKITVIEPTYGVERLNLLLIKIKYCIEKGMRSRGMTITSGKKLFIDVMGGQEEFDTDEQTEKRIIKLIPSDYAYYIHQCMPDRFFFEKEVENYLDKLGDTSEVIDLLFDAISRGGKPNVHDFSNSIIFVIANIDEAFVNAKQMDPDIDADTLYAHSKKITVFNIKDALRLRFRSEQIARLGNNYIIYPAFSSKAYRELIELELKKKSDVVKEKFGIEIIFDDTIKTIIYNEGVFPTQGSRPVFSTVNYMVSSFIGKVLSQLDTDDLLNDIKVIEWKFINEANKLSCYKNKKDPPAIELSYDVLIKIDNLRKPKKDDDHAIVCVHEAGHAVVYSVLTGELPTKIISSSAGGAEGFNAIDMKGMRSKEYTESIIATYLGGIEAEQMVFGKDKSSSSGAQEDIEMATMLAVSMVQYSGLYYPYALHPQLSDDNIKAILDVDKGTVEKVDALMREAREKAKRILKKYNLALKGLALALMDQTILSKEEVDEIFRGNGLVVEPKKKGEYVQALFDM